MIGKNTLLDLTVYGFEPYVGLCADSSEPGAYFGFCVSVSPCPPLLARSLSLSLSLKNKETLGRLGGTVG